MENVISDLSFIDRVVLSCVCSQCVISSWGSGTKPLHFPAIRTQSPLLRSEMRICTEIGKYACSTRKSSLQLSSALSPSADLNYRVSHTQLSLPEWFNSWRMRVNSRGTLQMNAAYKRSGWLRLFNRNLRASLPQLYIHVAAFTSPQHFILKGTS